VNAADDAERVSMLQRPRSREPRELAPGTCRVGASVSCPGSGNMCAGDQCCPGTASSSGRTFPCPSATSGFADCEQAEKEESCVAFGKDPLPSVSDIKGTHWADTSDEGGCSMPEASYTVEGAVALGDAPEMGELSAANNLCGQVVSVDCGGTPTVAVVASVCDINDHTCGVDMITNTWNPATGNAPYGEVTCKLSLTAENAMSGSSNQCFYRPDGVAGSSEYSTSVGLFNTGGKLVQSSTLAGIPGTNSGNSGYFDFDSQGQPLFVSSAELVTTFTDGSSVTTKYSECVKPSGAHIFG